MSACWLKTVHPRRVCAGAGLLCAGVVVESFAMTASFTFQARNGLGSQEWALDKVAEFPVAVAFFSSPSFGVRAHAAFGGRARQAYAVLVDDPVPVILFLQCRPAQDWVYPNWASFAYVSLHLATYFPVGWGGRIRRVV